MSKDFPVVLPQNDISDLSQGPLPGDLQTRMETIRARLPAMLAVGTVIQETVAPDVSVAAILDSGAETFDMTDLPPLTVTINDYDHSKALPGTPGVLTSALAPAIKSTNASADTLKVNIAGDGAQEIDIGTCATGALVAAAIQAGVRALTANTAHNQQALTGFTCEYVAPTVATTLSTALLTTTDYTQISVASYAGFKRGMAIKIRGSTTILSATVIGIHDMGASKYLRISTITTAEAFAIGCVVNSADDYYELTTGKNGADMSIVVTDGTSNSVADDLKLRVADGSAVTLGRDVVGPQTITFVTADFANDAAATAAEVVIAINKVLTGAVASVSSTKVRITTDRLGTDAHVTVTAGAGATALGYTTLTDAGTETEVALDLDGPEIIAIIPYTVSSGVMGAILPDPVGNSLVRVRRDHIVNYGGTDYGSSATVRWIVIMRPTAE